MMGAFLLSGCPESTGSNNDEDAGPPPVECDDGIDNDGDGAIDGADPDCSGPDDDSEETEAPPPPATQCADEEDNDGDAGAASARRR